MTLGSGIYLTVASLMTGLLVLAGVAGLMAWMDWHVPLWAVYPSMAVVYIAGVAAAAAALYRWTCS